MTEVVIPYRPRPQFKEYHDSGKRWSVSVCHRRAGKTVARVNKLIRSAASAERPYPPARFGYVAPFRRQAKEIAWLYLQHYAAPLLKYGGKVNQGDLTITMPHNSASIALYGAENAEAMRGLYFDGVVVDEAQGVSRATLSQIILPTLSDYQGWLDASGTPRGWENLLGELVKMAKDDPDAWFLQVLKASDSRILSTDELKRQRQLMSDNEYEQEYECNFDAAITGAVYGFQISAADVSGRLVASDIWVPGTDVHTAWDLGFDDSTAIWWFQVLPGELRIIDCYESSGEDIAHYCEILEKKRIERGFVYGKHYVPHDAAHELLAAGGRSIVQQTWALGVKMTVVAATSQQNGIEATRKTLERCFFDARRCESGINALRQYQFEFDPDKKVFRSKPRHDWSSHYADAFEIIGQVWMEPKRAAERPKPRFLDEARAEEVFDLQNKFMRRNPSHVRRI